jgi:hypothetical protein
MTPTAATGAPGATTPTGPADPRSALAEEIFAERSSGSSGGRRALGIALLASLAVIGFAGWIGYVQSQMPKDPLSGSIPMAADFPAYVACQASQASYGWGIAPAGVDVYTTTGGRLTALRLDLVPPSGGTPYALPAGQRVVAAVVTGSASDSLQSVPATGGEARMITLYSPDGDPLTTGADQTELEGDVAGSTDLSSLGTPVHRAAVAASPVCLPPP